jgi:hypothetical protein
MKKILFVSSILGALILTIIIGHLIYLNNLSKADSYPIDTFLQNQTNKKALIIVAHDDDAISMSGTISNLVNNGWEVQELCFYQGFENKDSIRKRDLDNSINTTGYDGCGIL